MASNCGVEYISSGLQGRQLLTRCRPTFASTFVTPAARYVARRSARLFSRLRARIHSGVADSPLRLQERPYNMDAPAQDGERVWSPFVVVL